MAQNIKLDRKTEINNEFLEKYLASAPAAYVLTYICAQKFIQEGKSNFTDALLAESLGMTESDVKKALKYWEDKGEFILRQKRVTVSAPVYSQEELRFYMDRNADFKGLINSAETNLGKLLSPSEVSTLYSFHDWLRLPLEVIEVLLAYCCDRGHRNMQYIESVAINWHDEGVCDVHSALDKINDYSNVYLKIMRTLGLGGKTPIDKQIEYMKRWTDKFPLDLILYGCEKTAMSVTSGNPFPYADKIFSNWGKSGIDTLDKAKAADEEFAKKKSSNSVKQSGEKVKKTKFTNYEEHEWDYDELSRIKFAELTKGFGGINNGH